MPDRANQLIADILRRVHEAIVENDVTYEWNNVPRRVTVSSFYMDETEVSNLSYVEYLYWTSRVFGPTFPQIYLRPSCRGDRRQTFPNDSAGLRLLWLVLPQPKTLTRGRAKDRQPHSLRSVVLC